MKTTLLFSTLILLCCLLSAHASISTTTEEDRLVPGGLGRLFSNAWHTLRRSLLHILPEGGDDDDDGNARRDRHHHYVLSDKFLDRLQARRDKGWTSGRNFHPAMSGAAIRGLMGVLPDKHRHHMPTYKPYTKAGASATPNLSRWSLIQRDEVTIPKEFDARQQWKECPSIAEIRDQGSCGSCWAIAAAGAMSDRLCIVRGEPHRRVSTENVLTCCTQCGFGCNGGFPGGAWAYWQEVGIVTGGAYNMTTDGFGGQQLCQSYRIPPCEHHVKGNRIQCKEIGKTPRCVRQCDDAGVSYFGSETYANIVYSVHKEQEEIQRELMDKGPVEASFTVYADFLHYKSGVYRHVEGDAMGGHAVRLIGWGEDDAGTPYWLVANSWNFDWGDQGTFKILRGSDHCGFESAIVAGY